MAKLYSAADITVLPYVEDNLPNVCLESIACGTPVVAFDIGGIPDVIIPGKNGQLARAFDVWDLANKVVTCLSEKTPTVDIRRWAKANIDIKDQAASYIDLFKESLDRSAKHG
jgi:glycosyltransferase involved in cell wall biosynthesis